MSAAASASASASTASHSAFGHDEQPSKRARLEHGEADGVTAAVHEAVQAALDSSAAAATGDKRDWEHGLSALIADYAAPALAYHVLCSDVAEPDVSSFDTAHAMLRELLRRRYDGMLAAGEGSEAEWSAAEVEAECAKSMQRHDRRVTAAQEKAEKYGDKEHPYDEEIAALHAQRVTLDGREEERREQAGEGQQGSSAQWSASSSPPLSASLSPLQPLFVLFQQGSLSWRGSERESWELHWFDSAEQLATFLRANPSGFVAETGDADGAALSLADLLRRALHLSVEGKRGRVGSCYLAAVFHRARTVWYVHEGGRIDDDDASGSEVSEDSERSDESADEEDGDGSIEEAEE